MAFALATCTTGYVTHLATAQTIIDGNQIVVANETTVGAAAVLVNGEHILTDAVLANLTALGLSNISLFSFASKDILSERVASEECKTYPGDEVWPDENIWTVLDLLTGNALIKDVPLASVCYDSWDNYDADECAYITEQWTNVSLHLPSPSDLMFPLWEGATCLPPELSTNEPTGNCTLGGFPSYIVNATTVAQIQLAVNLARNLNLRLVIKNTGHDFNGRSAGAGSLSVWTYSFKDLEFYQTYTTTTYSGPAMKIGAAIENKELFAAAEKYGVTGVGGLCTTVGAGGGFFAGGGHGPMTSMLGLGADQVLSVDVVTPDGRFVTASEDENTELFWALRGGGASTFGITTSWTVKVTPKLSSASVMKFSITSGANLTTETVWQAIGIYLKNIPTYNAAGNYEYFQIVPSGYDLELLISGWFAPNMTVEEHKSLVAPLFEAYSALGIMVNATWQQFDSYLPAWEQLTDAESVGWTTARSASRLVPEENLSDESKFNQTFQAIQDLYNTGSASFVGYGISANPGSYPDNAVNPAWRQAGIHLIAAIAWSADLTWAEVSDLSLKFTNNWLQPLRDATPGAGAYASEADILEPNWQQSFYGNATYERLYKFKQEIDPTGLFYAHKAVGSENWYVAGQLEGLPTQNGRLCRV